MKRELFSSPLAAILTMVGVAVGLGNVWRFPYMMGSHGGSAFLVVYLLFVAAFGIPAMMGEWALGRETRRGPLGAFRQSFGRAGTVVGAVLLVNVLIANSYYLVVITRLVYTAYHSIFVGFAETTRGRLVAGLANPGVQYPISIGLLFLLLITLGSGLVRGVERVSKLFVPFFGVVVVYMIVHSLRLEGVFDKLGEFLVPDFGAMTPERIFAAMGQAFFSLSLGGTFFLIYGSYLQDSESIPAGTFFTALGDVGASLLASLFIVPTVLVFGLNLASGPDLIFKTFPVLFGEMTGGRVVGSFFLVALASVAFLSSLAALQVIFGSLQDSFQMRSSRALLLLGGATAVLVLPSTLDGSLIPILDMICGSGMQCVGSGLALLALTWGLGKEVARRQLFAEKRGLGQRVLVQWIRWGVPVALAVALGNYLWGLVR